MVIKCTVTDVNENLKLQFGAQYPREVCLRVLQGKLTIFNLLRDIQKKTWDGGKEIARN